MRLVAATASALLLATPVWAAQQPAPQPATPAPVVLDLGQLDQVTAGNSALQKYRPQFYLRTLPVAAGGKLFVGNLSWPPTSARAYLRVTLRPVRIAS